MENFDLNDYEREIEMLKLGDQINLIKLQNLNLQMQLINQSAEQINRTLQQSNESLESAIQDMRKVNQKVDQPKPRNKFLGIF